MSNRLSRLTVLLLLVPLSLLVVGSTVAAGNKAKADRVLSIGENYGLLSYNFNPYVPAGAGAVTGAGALIYESLFHYRDATPDTTYPWLATSNQISKAGKVIVFELRHGVKWSDGQPFTAADVVFTFNLLKQNTALNTHGIKPLSVTALGSDRVKMTFSTPQYLTLYDIGSTPIVAAHIWKKVSNPVTYTDTNPVGTGPYLLKQFAQSSSTLVKNPRYWRPGQPYVSTVQFISFNSASAMATALESNNLTAAVSHIPNWKENFVGKDPVHHHVYYPGDQSVHHLWFNLNVYPLSMRVVRQAISEAIDRTAIHIQGESYRSPIETSYTGLPRLLDAQYIAPKYKKANAVYNPAHAKDMLLKAGFTVGSNGMLVTPKGDPFSVRITDPAPYTDYQTNISIIQSNLKQIGINVTLDAPDPAAWAADIDAGRFDMTIHWTGVGLVPYYNLVSVLTATPGYPHGGFKSAEAESLLKQYAATNSPKKIQAILTRLEGIMVANLPVVPIFGDTVGWAYNSQYFTGWPSAKNPVFDVGQQMTEEAVLSIRPLNT